MPSIIEHLDNISAFDAPCVLAVGMFDGLHLGHKMVVNRALELAKKYKVIPCALTFTPHPSTVVNMGRPPVKMLYGAQVRARMFKDAGLAKVFAVNFTKKFSALTPSGFEKFLRKKFPNLRAVVTGENFVFGANASGNFKTLSEMAARGGWEYSPVKGVMLDKSRRISSTEMRRALESGDMTLYKKMYGDYYFCEGVVKSGRKFGRTIGFPTLNLPWNPDCKPPYGVYAVELLRGGKTYGGVANYGVSPTVANTPPMLETHLFKSPDFGAGVRIKVRLIKFLRPEKKFASISALISQISKDKLRAQRIIGG